MCKKIFISSILIALTSWHNYAQETVSLHKEGVVTVNSNAKIDRLVNYKFSNSYGQDYKIQLYYGSLNKAHDVLNKFTEIHPDISGKILFETPNYKVWVGNFRTRLDADKALMDIRKKFPSAFIFKPKAKN